MNRYQEIRNANQDAKAEFRDTLKDLEELRNLFVDDYECSEIKNRGIEYSAFNFTDEVVREKNMKFSIAYVTETNKIELYFSGDDRRTNEQVKALLGLEGGVDWIYMFVLSDDYEPEEEDEHEDIYRKALSYMEFIETEIEDIV